MAAENVVEFTDLPVKRPREEEEEEQTNGVSNDAVSIPWHLCGYSRLVLRNQPNVARLVKTLSFFSSLVHSLPSIFKLSQTLFRNRV